MTEAMRWFRMHAEILYDPKVMTMPEAMRWRLVALMCLKCEGKFPAPDDQVSWSLDISIDELNEALALFKSRGFLTPGGDFRNWDKRQYRSDVSTERVRKHRETFQKRSSSVPEAPSETDTESDTDTETEKKVPSEPMSPTATDRVFDHWKATHGHPRASLDAKRRKVIQTALKSYSEADLCQAVTGYLNSPHHMGQNDSGTVYDAIELMLRDAKHIDAGLKFYTDPPRTDLSKLARQNVAVLADWVPPEVRDASK